MIGILLLTHAPLGQAFISTITHILCGLPKYIEAVDVTADQNPAEIQKIAIETICRLDDGTGVLVVTDIVGGTPANCARFLGTMNNIKVITGVNLPLLLRALTYRNNTLDCVIDMALIGGRTSIVSIR